MRTILLVLTLTLLSCTPALGDIDVNSILSQWQKNYGSITHMEFAFTDTVTDVVQKEGQNIPAIWDKLIIHTEQSGDGKYSSQYSVTRRNNAGELFVQKEKVVFDGIDQYDFSLNEGRCPTVVISGRQIKKGLNLYNELEFYFLTEKVGHPAPPNPPRQINYLEMMFPPIVPSDQLNIRPETEIVSGQVCVVLDILSSEKDRIGTTLWFAKDKGMLLMKYVRYDGRGGFLEKMEVLEVADSNGFWYPKKGRRTSNNFRTQYKSITHEVSVTKCVANPTYGQNEFKVTIPAGTIVYDDRIKENYFVGTPDD